LKPKRHIRILDIIQRSRVRTQEELVEALRDEGIEVTQATISRDIKDLRLVKIPTSDGSYRYALPSTTPSIERGERLMRILRDSIIDCDSSENMLVINTLPATAQVVAEALDALHLPEILGTLAGERTVFAVVRSREDVPQLLRRLSGLPGDPD